MANVRMYDKSIELNWLDYISS